MYRIQMNSLIAWRNRHYRKPLVLKGVRQCGKSYLVNEFGKSFPAVHIFNFQKDKNLSALFSSNIGAKSILEKLANYGQKRINIETDLIFFDEIQEVPAALNSLKYFNEELGNCYIIAAGSLLGVYLCNESFPVGKVEFLELYPMNFYEFLLANNKEYLWEEAVSAIDSNSNQNIPNSNKTIETLTYKLLIEEMQKYFIVGGQPEIVKIFIETQDLMMVRRRQEELLNAYRADFAKHSGKAEAMHILSVFENIPQQLAKDNRKFKFNLLKSGSRYDRFKNAIDWLIGAGMAYKIPIIEHGEIPLKIHVQENIFKLYFFDVGLLATLSELPTNSFSQPDDLFKTFKGAFSENFFLQEFRANRSESLYCWQGKTSEVGFVYHNNEGLFPIEIKSGHSGHMNSLNIFCEKYTPKWRTRVSLRNFEENTKSSFRNFPLFLSSLA